MKKSLKWLGIIVIFVLAILITFALIINLKGIPTYKNEARPLTLQVDSAGLAEGTRMAMLMCAQCHTSSDGRLGGGYMADASSFGQIYAPNITQHPTNGIADYTDGELAFLLRTGIKKDGRFAPPYMPKFPHLSDEDLDNLIAFMRSDHVIVQPSENQPPPSRPNFMMKLLCNLVIRPLPYPEGPILGPDKKNAVAWGKYISTAKFECYSCHSESFVTQNILEPEKTPGFFGGGNPIPNLEGDITLSVNLTMDPETGLGNWTIEEFIKAVKLGIKPDGTMVRFPMMPYTLLTDDEIEAIWAYLQTIPVIVNSNNLSE